MQVRGSSFMPCFLMPACSPCFTATQRFESRLEHDRRIAPITHQTGNDRQFAFRITLFGGLEYYKILPIFSKTLRLFALI